MGAIRYSCPIRLIPTYILPSKERRLLGQFQPDSFKTERLVCGQTDGQTDMARLTRLVMLIKNILVYTLWGRKRLLHWNHNTLASVLKLVCVLNVGPICFEEFAALIGLLVNFEQEKMTTAFRLGLVCR